MESLLAQITNYLLAQSWHIALLTIAVALISFLLRNKSAHIRYILWLIVLAKCLVPPLYTIPVAILPEQEKPEYTPAPSIAESMITEYSVSEVAATESSRPISIQPETMSSPTITERQARYDTQALLVIGWLVGVVTLSLYYFINALRTQIWLHKRRKKLPSEYKKNIESLFNTHSIRRIPHIWLLDKVSQPFVWGLVRGSIYLPTKMLDSNHTKFQASLLGHELSHVIRFDAMINSLQVVAQAIFWFHPLVWWANKKIRAEREKCCDEMTIARLDALPEDYSEAIVETLAAKNESALPVPSLAVAGQVKNIEERIKTMLRPGKKFYKRPSAIALSTVLLLAVLIVPTGCVLTKREGIQTKTEQDKHYTSTELLRDNGADVNDRKEDDYTQLYNAIWNDKNKDMVSLLISKGADVNYTPRGDYSPLIIAIWSNDENIAKLLVDHGAKFDVKDLDGWTAFRHATKSRLKDTLELFIANGADTSTFHMAACMGNLERVKDFIAKGAEVDARDEEDWTPLYWAVSMGRTEVARFLIAQGADVKAMTNNQSTALHQAAGVGDIDIVQLLIDKGADVNARDRRNMVPLYTVSNKEVAELLIRAGADVNLRDPIRGGTPLLFAAGRGHTEVVQILIDNGADVTTTNNLGRTALRQAKERGHTKVVELLRKSGAKETLHGAVASGNIDEVKRLIAQGADVNAKAQDDLTPLLCARELPIVELLVSNGANIEAKNRSGRTLLHLACRNGYKDIAEYLIHKGADVNARSISNMTPLWLAAGHGNVDIAKVLIANGADINAKDNQGLTPLDHATQTGQDTIEIVELLKKHGAKETLYRAARSGNIEAVKSLISQGADVNVKYNSGRTPLFLACRRGNKEIAELLIDKGADINAKVNNGRTPLHIAAIRGHIDIVKLLIAKGADINARTSSGHTPLVIAEQEGHTEIVELLKKHGAKE